MKMLEQTKGARESVLKGKTMGDDGNGATVHR